jgi:hypothetical protein
MSSGNEKDEVKDDTATSSSSTNSEKYIKIRFDVKR